MMLSPGRRGPGLVVFGRASTAAITTAIPITKLPVWIEGNQTVAANPMGSGKKKKNVVRLSIGTQCRAPRSPVVPGDCNLGIDAARAWFMVSSWDSFLFPESIRGRDERTKSV